MTGVNKAIVVGHLGKDPEIRRTQDGRPIATLSIATSESWRDKATGERKERTQWHRVVCFAEPLCDVIEKYLKKGSKAYVEGQMETRDWTDQGGVKRYVTEIVLRPFNSQLVLLDKAGGGGVPPNDGSGEDPGRFGSAPASGGSDAGRSGVAPRGGVPRTGPGSDMDDDILF